MRVHPSFVAPKRKRWQFPAAFGLLLFLLIMNFVRGPRVQVQATQPVEPKVKMQEVLVVTKALQAGEPIEQSSVALEKRPLQTLPSDAISVFTDLQGKVAAGPVPVGYPLAKALITDPVPVVPVSDSESIKELDPIEMLLEEIMAETVAVPVNFRAKSPPRGTRIALALSGVRGDTVLVLDECWISEGSGNKAVLRVPADKALFLQSIEKLGQFSFIEIPIEGSSPYTGHALEDLDSVEVALGLKAGSSKKAKSNEPAGPRTFKSYAWINGTPRRYGIDEEGKIFIVDEHGREVAGPVSSTLR
ncbi:MAG: SAF domain-containing protein [Deltaproteobacteria bacterium]|nr:SAF domain-containing protein [Deltaproteobacteria bacterium]